MADKTPEALRLAGKLYDDGDVPSLEECSQAASLLRRQHQRIEELVRALRIARTAALIGGALTDDERRIVDASLISTTQQEDSQA